MEEIKVGQVRQGEDGEIFTVLDAFEIYYGSKSFMVKITQLTESGITERQEHIGGNFLLQHTSVIDLKNA